MNAEWLHRFINCTPFGAEAPASEIARAHEVVSALEQDLAEARDKVEALHVLLQARDAETDALRKQQCMTCQHSRIGTGINSVAFYYCNKHCKPCDKFGHHCGMWARREP